MQLIHLSGHPWIVDDRVAPDKPLDSAVLSRLKEFSAMNKLKKMALRVCYHPYISSSASSNKSIIVMIDSLDILINDLSARLILLSISQQRYYILQANLCIFQDTSKIPIRVVRTEKFLTFAK